VIYADNAATTKISPNVLEKMLPFLHENYGNASSQCTPGIKAKRAIENAREQISRCICSNTDEIYFTSGGTEANNWMLRSVADAYLDKNPHFITSKIEHPSVLYTCRVLEKKGVEVTYLPVNNCGQVLIDDFVSSIKQNTVLVSIMLANNETGVIQPIADIGKLLRDKDILFHTDAVQAVGRIPVNVFDLQVDFLTASAHKFYGAKGTGILFKRLGVDLQPFIYGGGQENGIRSGTENVASIVAAGFAIEECSWDMDSVIKRQKDLMTKTIEGIIKHIPDVRINSGIDERLPGIINIGFDGVSGESLMHLLDLKGICVSTSSACSAGRDEPSHVLLAMGQTDKQAKSAIRISYGRYNTDEDASAVAKAVCEVYKKVKSLS
jgi:cysteine desulfurase